MFLVTFLLVCVIAVVTNGTNLLILLRPNSDSAGTKALTEHMLAPLNLTNQMESEKEL